MELLTKELERRFAAVGRQEALGDKAIVVAKYFTPGCQWTWYATEYDPETRQFFGLVDGFEAELGYFSLDEMEAVTSPMGLAMERDLHWKEVTLSEVKAALSTGNRL
jgi:hypothetical protein